MPLPSRIHWSSSELYLSSLVQLFMSTILALETNLHYGQVSVVSLSENKDTETLRPRDDVFKSTVHRAMNKSGKERYSIPLFFGTDYHVNIEVRGFSYETEISIKWSICISLQPIPSCVSADRPAKYSPITAGEHVSKRLKDMYHTA